MNQEAKTFGFGFQANEIRGTYTLSDEKNIANVRVLIAEMNDGPKMAFEFWAGRDGIGYATVKSILITPQTIRVNEDVVKNIFSYLMLGQPFPDSIDTETVMKFDLENGTSELQFDVFKKDYEMFKNPRITPKSRNESEVYVNAISNYSYGWIRYRFKKNAENVDYLKKIGYLK